MGCGVDCRHCSDPALLWLWRRPAAAAPMRPLVWEPPYATGVALKKKKKKKKTKKKPKKQKTFGAPVVAQWLTNPTRNHEVAGSVPALAQWVKDPALP